MSIEGSCHAISRIAYEAGYADHPHLCREFRTAAGMSPTAFRKLARGA
jgi:AraC-like DNA-binding protein